MKMSDAEERAEETAQGIEKENQKRSPNFTFDECSVPDGAVLVNIENQDIVCKVVDRRRVEYCGEIMSVTTLARLVSGKSYYRNGPRYLYEHFTYRGARLDDIDGRNP